MNATLKILRDFITLPDDFSEDFFVLECVGANCLIEFVGTDFKTAGMVKGQQVP
jgi:hypothetical protein